MDQFSPYENKDLLNYNDDFRNHHDPIISRGNKTKGPKIQMSDWYYYRLESAEKFISDVLEELERNGYFQKIK